MIRYKLGRNTYWPVKNVYGAWSQDVDLITNRIDMGCNTHYNTFESPYVENKLAELDITDYDLIKGGIPTANTQFLTVRFYDKEDIVKLRICMDEIEPQYTNPYNLPKAKTKEILCT